MSRIAIVLGTRPEIINPVISACEKENVECFILERNEEGGYTVTVPSLPGCITQGATWDEAIAHGREAIAGYLETLRDLGKPIPVEVAGEVAAEANGRPRV
jgi:antitoxin HicB